MAISKRSEKDLNDVTISYSANFGMTMIPMVITEFVQSHILDGFFYGVCYSNQSLFQ
jgi:hypothetical protein